VRFVSSSNRVYTLQWATDLNDPGTWRDSSPPPRPGNGGWLSLRETNRVDRLFDRVLVELPP
jgi:hypothetical protein